MSFFFILDSSALFGQSTRPSYWQQRVDYTMEVELDVQTHKVLGKQQLVYTNNSPDTLYKFYYLLYFNAFQPESMMDVRSRTIVDPDRRVRDRIFHLSEDEIGYQKVFSLKQNGKDLVWKVEDTVLETVLAEPIPPGQSATFDMEYESQVPLQIRRSGRDNAEGIAYSMTQWYPKAAEYDDHGWQAHPYIGREFYPVWGDFDVKITLDADYTVGASGVLQNAEEIRHGYEGLEGKPEADKLTWHFFANDVHDFAWAADESYTHEVADIDEERKLHLIYVDGPQTRNWKQLAGFTIQAFDYLDEHIGPYPWKQYTVIQGGDGGMEYPNITLITGHRSLGSLVGVTVHELLHSWFQGLFAFDETRYSWMDEGFTSYYSNRVMAHLFGRRSGIQNGSHRGYHALAASGLEEPLTTHSDHYETNFAYGRAAYSKGAVFLDQLEYVIGTEAFEAGMKLFYKEWAFKHPRPMDLMRCMEKTSGIELDWYFDQWIGTTRRIDYGVKLNKENGESVIELTRKDKSIMPIDLKVEFEDGSVSYYHIPLSLMRGEKTSDTKLTDDSIITAHDWQWTKPNYQLKIEDTRAIKSVEIDPTHRLADYNPVNNAAPFAYEMNWMEPIRSTYEPYQVSARPSLWFGENAGVIAGFRAYGIGFQNDRSVDFQLMLTSGNLDNYSATQTDVDFKIAYEQSIEGWGKQTTLGVDARRYFGIFDISATLSKGLNTYGFLNDKQRFLKFRPFLLTKTAERQTNFLNAGWQRGEVLGLETSFIVGDPGSNGYRVTATLASHDRDNNSNHVSASSVEFVWNKTYNWIKNVNTRIGTGVGLGSNNMPTQLRWTIAGPTNYQLWRNEAWTGLLNLSNSIANDLWLAPTSSGLEGYLHPDNQVNPDLAGNNYMLLTVWNSWKHNPRAFYELEWYMGAGRSWNGEFFGDNVFAVQYNPEVLLSSGIGFSYDPAGIKALRKWIPQSDILQKMKFSIRMPFFTYGVPGQNDFTPRLLFGISDSF